jgi:hypothetical protein
MPSLKCLGNKIIWQRNLLCMATRVTHPAANKRGKASKNITHHACSTCTCRLTWLVVDSFSGSRLSVLARQRRGVQTAHQLPIDNINVMEAFVMICHQGRSQRHEKGGPVEKEILQVGKVCVYIYISI